MPDDYSGPFNPTWQRRGLRPLDEEEERRRKLEAAASPVMDLSPFGVYNRMGSDSVQKAFSLPGEALGAMEGFRRGVHGLPPEITLTNENPPLPPDELSESSMERMFPSVSQEPEVPEGASDLRSMFPPPEGMYPDEFPFEGPRPLEPPPATELAKFGAGGLPDWYPKVQNWTPPETEPVTPGQEDPKLLAAREAAFQRDQDRNRGLQEGIRSFSEGLGNFQVTTPGHILSGWRSRQEPFVAEGAREELARQRDVMSPSQRAMIKQAWGMDLPAEARWSQVSGVLPYTSRAIQGGASDAYRWANLAQRMRESEALQGRYEGNRDLRNEALGISRDRLGLSREQFGRLPAPVMTKVSAALKARTKLDELDRDFQSNAAFHENVGPIWGRLQTVARHFGVNNPEFTRESALLRDAISEYLTLQTGAQRGMVEVFWISEALPKVTDSGTTFKSLIDGWKRRLDLELNTMQSTYGAAGWNTDWIPGAAGQGGAPPSNDGLQSGEVEVYNTRTGQRWAVPESALGSLDPDWRRA